MVMLINETIVVRLQGRSESIERWTEPLLGLVFKWDLWTEGKIYDNARLIL